MSSGIAPTTTKNGLYNSFSSTVRGVLNGDKYGYYNYFDFDTSTGNIYGTYTRIENYSDDLKYGTYNSLSEFTGSAYGVYNSL